MIVWGVHIPWMESGPVRHEVPHRDLAAHPGIVHLQLGQVAGHGVVPFELPLLDEDGERGAGERLAVGGNAEAGLPVDGRGLADTADPEAPRQDHVPVLDDADPDPGHVELVEHTDDDIAEALEGRRLFRPARDGDERGHHEGDNERPERNRGSHMLFHRGGV